MLGRPTPLFASAYLKMALSVSELRCVSKTFAAYRNAAFKWDSRVRPKNVGAVLTTNRFSSPSRLDSPFQRSKWALPITT